jgi:hypothetical protein
MKLKLLIVCLFIIPATILAQRSSKGRGTRFPSKKVYELTGAIGVTNFLGDVGGADNFASRSLKDLNYSATRFGAAIGARMFFIPSLAGRVNLLYARISGSDANTNELFRHNRNLSFRTDLIELSAQAEYYFLRGRNRSRFGLRGIKGSRRQDIQLYAFVGAGAFYFNPKGKYTDGKWYSLQPLGTEGEALLPDTKKYSRINICIPFGLGVQFFVNKYLSVGVEGGFRFTFSDYIDDVSKNYSAVLVKEQRGPIAGYFADPTLGKGANDMPRSVADGVQRGNPGANDSYMFLGATATYKLLSKKNKWRPKFY